LGGREVQLTKRDIKETLNGTATRQSRKKEVVVERPGRKVRGRDNLSEKKKPRKSKLRAKRDENTSKALKRRKAVVRRVMIVKGGSRQQKGELEGIESRRRRK